MDRSYNMKMAEILRTSILTDNLRQIKYHLEQQPITKRRQIVSCKVYGSPALITACELQRHSIVRYLLENCPINVNIPSASGATPIRISCNMGDVSLLEYLHKKGGNIHVLDSYNRTLLMTYITNANISNYLLSQGISMQARDNGGLTALDHAISTSSLRSIELLAQYGASLNLPNNLGKTPVFEACDSGKLSLLELLIENKADINITDAEGRTYLMLFTKNSSVCHILIQRGIDINAKDNQKRTALHYIISDNADYNIAEFLLTYNVFIDERDDEGLTPSAYAIVNGNVDVLELLLKSGINVNNVDENGLTLLHRAVERKSLDCVKLLVAHGANITLCNTEGKNPIEAAVELNHKDIVDTFIQECSLEARSKIQAYELLASNEFEMFNYKQGYDCQRSAINWRRQCCLAQKPKTILNSIFLNKSEPETFEELMDVGQDNVGMLVQVILTRGRILGPFHESIMDPIESYIKADSDLSLEEEIQIRKHVCTVVLRAYGPTSFDALTHKGTLVEKLWNVVRSNINISIPFVLEVFEDFTNHMKLVEDDDTETLSTLLKEFVNLVYLLLVEHVGKSDASLHSKLEKIITLCPEESGIRPILIHFLLDDICDGNFPFIPGAFLMFIHLLLKHGVEIDRMRDGKMPLHKYFRCIDDDPDISENDREIIDRTIHILVSNGNHLCTEDCDNVTIFQLLEERSYPVCRIRDRTLQCLAANVITMHKIQYADVAPHLIPFINLHEHQEVTRSRSSSSSDTSDSSSSC